MARKNQSEMEVNPKSKKVRCFGHISQYYNNPARGYVVPGGGPYVMFYKKKEEFLGGNGYTVNQQVVQDGDTVIEFEEVARYKIKNVAPSLEPLGQPSEPSSETTSTI